MNDTQNKEQTLVQNPWQRYRTFFDKNKTGIMQEKWDFVKCLLAYYHGTNRETGPVWV